MKLLLDQGLPRSTVLHLHNAGIEVFHAGDRGLASASDSRILDLGLREGMTVVTLDADFHKLLAISGATGPSVIRIRIQGLRAEGLARLLVNVLQVCRGELTKGAMISVTENDKVRIKQLPIIREQRPTNR